MSETSTAPKTAEGTEKRVVAKILRIIEEDNINFYIDQRNDVLVTLPKQPFIGIKIQSKEFRQHITKRLWSSEGNILRNEQLKTVLDIIEITEKEKAKQVQSFVRVGSKEDNGELTIYYDLGNNESYVEITSSGWEIKSNFPGILFLRYPHQKAQITPSREEDLKKLFEFCNIQDKNVKILLSTYLAVALIPDIPRYAIIVYGDKGSAKSTFQRLIHSLIDPNEIELQSLTHRTEDLGIYAGQNYILVFDNLSGIKNEQSDTLCRVISGDGNTRRKLYTDTDMVFWQAMRLVCISGIHQVANRSDLIDRSLLIRLNRIDSKKRQEIKTLLKNFEEAKPAILGGIFTAASKMLKIKPQLKLDEVVRMADHYSFATAAGIALGYSQEEVKRAFNANIEWQNQDAIEASAIAQILIEFMKNKSDWEGSSSELYVQLKDIAYNLGLEYSFVKNASWLWRKIAEIKTNLEEIGINCHHKRQKASARIILTKNDSSDDSVSNNLESKEAQETFDAICNPDT